ncbi:hypothetical protein [Acrocarpospora corrugata]|uniref:hypothetical protein n=1 Tax=Acrocarpospora corrugata TaxID=35763 RepID=UPI0012D302AD|nr:hypothetical protein [Acrocarpospora corrugata]
MLHIEAGHPTLATVERVAVDLIEEKQRAGVYDAWRRLPKSTVSDVLGGKCRKLPDWQFFHTFVAVCARLAAHNDLVVPAPSELMDEFGKLWKAAMIEMGGSPYLSPQRWTPGDILEPNPDEVRIERIPPIQFRMPRAWGRSGAAILRRAGMGDANAAYQAAILLACEASLKPDDAEGKQTLLDMAAFWRGKATGKVEKAAALRLDGIQLRRAAENLALGYKRSGKPCVIFFRAFLQAEAAMGGTRVGTGAERPATRQQDDADSIRRV